MLNKFKNYIKLHILLCIMLFTSSCSLITKNVYIVPPLPQDIFSSCNKPSSILDDLNVKDIEELSKESNEVVDSLLMKAYAKNKVEYIACFRTLVNVKSTYGKLQKEIELNNK